MSTFIIMRIPKFPVTFLSILSAILAWYAYNRDSPQHILKGSDSEPAQRTHSLSPTPNYGQPTDPLSASAPVTEGCEIHGGTFTTYNDQISVGAIRGDGPLVKDTNDSGRKVLEMTTPHQATQKLRKHEQSLLLRRGWGMVRYDVVQLPSNDPIEDDHAEKMVEVPDTVAATDGPSSSDWMFWGVFDGHSGWTTSAKLRQALISFVIKELSKTYKDALSNTTSPFPSPAAVDEALKSAFVTLDNEICLDSVRKLNENPTRQFAAEILAPALSGSCALLSFYDSQSKTLRIACTGDSRAVLGRRNPQTGKWYASPLSEDQTGSNPKEEARVRAEHPGEDYVIRAVRVFGTLEPTRAFGDASYKWTRKTQARIKKHFFGRTPSQLLKSPPYVTAEPIITRTRIEPSQRDFLVIATDGLWRLLTNDEVVDLVGQWIVEQEKTASNAQDGAPAWPRSWLASSSRLGAVPVGPVEKSHHGNKPVGAQHIFDESQNQNRFVVEDRNAATHLVRNALGGKDTDMVCGLLTLPSPYSRRYRDDLTVEVIFFGEGEDGESVDVNVEAAAQVPGKGIADLKAKL